MNDVMRFSFDGAEVRTIVINGEPWFVLSDLCKVLGLGTAAKVAERLDEAGVSKTHIRSGGQMRAVTIVNEPNMYRLVLRSNKPVARRLETWLVQEVLPTIRKSGGAYIAPGSQAEADLLNPDTMIEKFGELLDFAKEERAKRLEAEAKSVELEAVIEQEAPYIKAAHEFFDDAGLIGFRDASRALGVPQTEFMDLLRAWKWIDQVGTAVQSHVWKGGYGKNLIYKIPGGGHRINGKLTRQGFERVVHKLSANTAWLAA